MSSRSHDDDQDGKLDGLELYQSVLHGLYHQVDRMVGVTEEQRLEQTKRVMNRLVRELR